MVFSVATNIPTRNRFTEIILHGRWAMTYLIETRRDRSRRRCHAGG
jgi:hypothetical protein